MTRHKPKENICPRCQAMFHCGSDGEAGRCWCAALPRMMPVQADGACWCPDCLRREVDDRVSLYKMNGADAPAQTPASEEA